MNTRRLWTFFMLLAVGLGTNTAWSGQNEDAGPATESHANASQGATAQSGQNTGAADQGLPSIVDEEDIPAFLLTDPCDTEDS